MSSKLFTRYSFDECQDENKLFKKLDSFLKEDKIEYSIESEYLFKIKDIELSEKEISDLSIFFENIEVYPYIDESIEEEDESDYDVDDYDENDYSSKRYRRDDDYNDDF
jgi:hypothetical protein